MTDLNYGLDNGATVVGVVHLRSDEGVDRIMAYRPKTDAKGIEYVVATHRGGDADWTNARFFRTEVSAWEYFTAT